MTKLVGYSLNAPFKGMATQIDPVLAAQQGFLADAINVTYDEVAAKPIPRVMQEVAQVPDFPYLLHYHYGYGWITDKVFMPSGIYNWAVRGARSAGGHTVSYVTGATGVTTGYPKKYFGTSQPVLMGINPPPNAPGTTPGARNNIRAAYTFSNYGTTGDDEIESNPSPATAAFKDGGSVTVTWPSNSRVTAAYVYATDDNDPDGTLYLVGRQLRSGAAAGTTSTFSLSSFVRDFGIALNWGLGGFEGSESGNSFDHAPPGKITCFSDKFHGTEGGSDDNKGGTLFYAIDNVVGWTETGEPEYFPEVNKYTLPGVVQALVSYGNQTFAFLSDQVWAFSGQHSTAITARQVDHRRGVGIGKAKTVVSTPYGIVYASREGLAIFDGSNIRIVCQEVFREFGDTNHWCAAYVDGIYYLCRPATSPVESWRIDLRNQQQIVATKTSIRFFSSHALAADDNLSPAGASLAQASSTWSDVVTYSASSLVVVEYGGYSYQRKAKFFSLQGANTGNDPILRQSYWSLVPDAQVYLGLENYDAVGDGTPWWSSLQTYSQGDVVEYNGKRYESINAAANTNNLPSAVGSAWWQEYTPATIDSFRRVPVCPYTEDPLVNQHDPLPMTLQTHPLRLGPIHSVSKLRRARVDGIGSATVTLSFNADAARTYTRAVSATNNAADRFMLPMSLYGDNFTIKVESTTAFTLRQVELEGSTNR